MKRDLEKERPPPLRIISNHERSSTTHRRQPVIIHTYSPEVITVEACNFRRLVQRLTGPNSSPTASPLPKRSKPSSSADYPSLISTESLNPAPNTSSQNLTEDVLSVDNQEEESPYYGSPNPDSSSIQNPNPNFESNDSIQNPNPNPNSMPVLPPFAKPSSFFNHPNSIKHNSSLLSPPVVDDFFLLSPSFFDLSPSLLPFDPSSLLPNFSPSPLKDQPNAALVLSSPL